MSTRSLPTIQLIEAEHGAKMLDILLGYASDGEALTSAAQIIGMNPKTLRRLIKREGWDIPFAKFADCNAVKYREPRRDKSFWVRAYPVCPQYKWITVDGVRDTIAGHCRRVGISKRTVYNRIARGITPEAALKKKSLVCCPGTKNHSWRQYVKSSEALGTCNSR